MTQSMWSSYLTAPRAASCVLLFTLGGCTGSIGPGGAQSGALPGTGGMGGGAPGTASGGSSGPSGPMLDCTAPHAAVVRSQQLSSTQYTNTVRDLFQATGD